VSPRGDVTQMHPLLPALCAYCRFVLYTDAVGGDQRGEVSPR